MKKRRNLLFFLLVSLMLVLSLFCGIRAALPEKKKDPETISVLLPDSENTRWNSLRNGIESAAHDFNVHVKVIRTNGSSLSEDQIHSAAGGSISGVIVNTASKQDEDILRKSLSGRPVVFAESQPQEISDNTGVLTIDNEKASSSLAEIVLRNEASGSLSIGLISGSTDTLRNEEREKGITDRLAEDNISPAWSMNAGETDVSSIVDQLKEHPVSVLICLDDAASENAVNAISQIPDVKPAVYGFGRSDKCIYYTDMGLIRDLVVSDDYLMGYNAVKQLSQRIQNHTPLHSENISWRIVTKENLFTEKNQQLLFPIEQ